MVATSSICTRCSTVAQLLTGVLLSCIFVLSCAIGVCIVAVVVVKVLVGNY